MNTKEWFKSISHSIGRVGAASAAIVLLISAALLHAVHAPAGPHDYQFSIRNPDSQAMPEPFSNDLPAKGKFLVAGRNLIDPRFEETVVLLIDYSAEGAAGVIINRPTKVPLAEVLPSVPGLKARAGVVYYGGPVEGRRMLMLIRSGERPEESGRVFGNVYVSASMDTLERMIASHKTDRELRMYAGYAGWMPQQLDREVSRGDWLIMSADAGSIFEKKSSGIWRELYQRGSAIQVWNQQ